MTAHHPDPAAARRHRAAPALGGVLRQLLALLLVPLLLLAGPAGAAELQLVEVGPPGAAPAPGYPVPDDPGMVFYLQRSPNPNTVVYAARYDAAGTLDAGDPLSAYWRRFNTDGQVKDLSMLERRLAYGVKTSPRPGGGFDVRFRALPDLPLVLEQRGPGQAVLSFAPKGQSIDLTHGYLEVNEGGLMPEVTAIRLFGRRRADGQPVEVAYSVDGGAIGG